MTAPTFDAHGWCHDMDAAPLGEPVFTWIGGDPVIGERFSTGRLGWAGAGWRWSTEPTAWRPLPLPPVGAE
jgi:hypothetical protein